MGVTYNEDSESTILVRVYGENTDKIIDRTTEIKTLKVRFKQKIRNLHTQSFFFIFNGFIYIKDASRFWIWTKTICHFFQWHSLSVSSRYDIF